MVRFASLPSKLPRGLAEILWNGVAYVIVRKISQLEKLKASVGFEPEGIAKIAYDLHGPYQIFMATTEEGLKVLYDYVGVKYAAPVLPPKPISPAKAPIPGVAKPVPPAVARPVTPTTPGPAVTPPTAVKPPTPQSTALSPPKSTPMSVPTGEVSQSSQSPSPVKPEDSSQKREKKDAPAPSTA